MDLWIFGFLDFWVFGFLDFLILDSQTCGYLGARICISVYRRCQGWIMLRSIYAPYTYFYAHMCMNTHRWLNQAVAVAEGYLANRILVQ